MILKEARALESYADMLFKINILHSDGAINDVEASRMMEQIVENLENYLPKMKHTIELLKKSRL